MAQAPDVVDWYGSGQAQPASTATYTAVSVGTSSVAIDPATGQLAIGLRAEPTNTGTIYVDSVSQSSFVGWPLKPGEFLALATSAIVYVIASVTGQVVHVLQLSS